jgi:hypothetical protein
MTLRERIKAVLEEHNQNPDGGRYGEDTLMYFGASDGEEGVDLLLDALVGLFEETSGNS